MGRYLVATLHRPHRVLSTCPVNGGLCEHLTHIANHQSCEGAAHRARYERIMGLGPSDYHAFACAEAGLAPERTALMGTAANMQCAVVAHARAEDLGVTLVATAGVLGNATRAGDPAAWHETREGSRAAGHSGPAASAPTSDAAIGSPSTTQSGTIVTLALIDQPCTPACLVRAATILTEAKTTALLDLRLTSLQSPRLATGTGTDQLAIAAPVPRAGDWERQWAGSHDTLGELVARATHEAVTRALLLQNGIAPALRRNVLAALGRWGCDESLLRACAEAELDADTRALFLANLPAILHDPASTAAAYALAEIIDLVAVGVLHEGIARASILDQAALLGAAVAVRPEVFVELRAALAVERDLSPARLAALALIRGFARKWI